MALLPEALGLATLGLATLLPTASPGGSSSDVPQGGSSVRHQAHFVDGVHDSQTPPPEMIDLLPHACMSFRRDQCPEQPRVNDLILSVADEARTNDEVQHPTYLG